MAAPRILLVDDTKLFLRLEQEYLKQTSAVVLTAGNGREALEIIRGNRPDLIFMDLNMPEMDGVTCCATIKADPELRSIPVILVTTEGKDDSKALCRAAGCDGYLTKPINRKVFLDLGRKFLPDIDRREKRVTCRIKALFRINNGDNVYGTCIDLCCSGLYVAYSGQVEAEDRVEVSLLVAGSSDDLVEAWGRVSWVNTGSPRIKQALPEGFGVEILAITDESVRLIRKFIGQGISIAEEETEGGRQS
ncbi:MAG: response regulator [Geobacteraceae bacterium]|nr:response regulator [Geobacteraceae bacterium]